MVQLDVPRTLHHHECLFVRDLTQRVVHLQDPPPKIPPLGHLPEICTHICIRNWTIINLAWNGNNNEIKKYRFKGFKKVVENVSFISNRPMPFLFKLACFKASRITNLLMMWDIFLGFVATYTFELHEQAIQSGQLQPVAISKTIL